MEHVKPYKPKGKLTSKALVAVLLISSMGLLVGVFYRNSFGGQGTTGNRSKSRPERASKALSTNNYITGPQKKKQFQKDFSVSTPDLSNWKIYRNEKYGYEIKYPPDWRILEEVDDPTSGAVVQGTYFGPKGNIRGYVGTSVDSRPLEKAKQSLLGVIKPVRIEKVTINGIDAIKVEGKDAMLGERFIGILIPTVLHKTYYIDLAVPNSELYIKVNHIFQQMVTSYRIIDKRPKR